MLPSNRLIVLLLSLQVEATVFLWTLDTISQASESTFALFLAVDLVSFAIISYIYRTRKQGGFPQRGWIIVGCVLVLVLLFSSLLVS